VLALCCCSFTSFHFCALVPPPCRVLPPFPPSSSLVPGLSLPCSFSFSSFFQRIVASMGFERSASDLGHSMCVGGVVGEVKVV
jgi:hypothetical protein